jgi:hypothetical protein
LRTAAERATSYRREPARARQLVKLAQSAERFVEGTEDDRDRRPLPIQGRIASQRGQTGLDSAEGVPQVVRDGRGQLAEHAQVLLLQQGSAGLQQLRFASHPLGDVGGERDHPLLLLRKHLHPQLETGLRARSVEHR